MYFFYNEKNEIISEATGIIGILMKTAHSATTFHYLSSTTFSKPETRKRKRIPEMILAAYNQVSHINEEKGGSCLITLRFTELNTQASCAP